MVSPGPSLSDTFNRLGPIWVGVLYGLILSNLVFLAPAMVWTWWIDGPDIINVKGSASGLDFLAFWSAAKIALSKNAAAAYDFSTIAAVQHELTGLDYEGVYPWHYPPTFLLLILPLALAPYLVALAIWQAVPLPALVAIMSRFGLPSRAIWLVPLSPAVTQSLIAGQNGIFWTLLLALAVLNLERRPWLAGAAFGILTFKPHLAIVIGPALLVGRCWTSLFAMVASTLAMLGASVVFFGFEPWLAFIANVSYPAQLLVAGDVPWSRMPTVFAAARLAGLDILSARGLHSGVAVVVIVGVAWVWWKRIPLAARCSVMIAAIPLITPFAFDYDMVMLLLPLAWLLKAGARGGWHPGERVLLVIVWLLPVWWLNNISEVIGLSAAPVILLLFFAAICRRALVQKTRRVSASSARNDLARPIPQEPAQPF